MTLTPCLCRGEQHSVSIGSGGGGFLGAEPEALPQCGEACSCLPLLIMDAHSGWITDLVSNSTDVEFIIGSMARAIACQSAYYARPTFQVGH